MDLVINKIINDYYEHELVLYYDGYYFMDYRLEKLSLIIQYFEALGKSYGLAVDATPLLQNIHQELMNFGYDEMYAIKLEDLNFDYSKFSNQLSSQYLSLLDIEQYSINISGCYLNDEAEETEIITELMDCFNDFPENSKELILEALFKDQQYYDSLLRFISENPECGDVFLDIYIDKNYTKYKNRYEKRFKNDHTYQALDSVFPEYASSLCQSSLILKDGTRCDIFLGGYIEEFFMKNVSTINHQYFLELIKTRKKLNLL